MDVKAIQARLAAHAVERNWDPFFSPRSLSMALASGSGALLAMFQWLSEEQARRIGKTQQRNAVAESLADIVLYAVRLADAVEVDLEEAVLARAANKYPVSARRFEGVDDREAGTTRPQPVPPAPPRPAPEARRSEVEAERAPPRAAPPRDEPPPRMPPPAPVRIPQVRVTDDGPREAARQPARPEPPPRGRSESPARERASASRARPEPSARERAEPAPVPREQPAQAPRAERYANLDINAVLELMKVLTRRIDDSRSDETLLHELKDEMATLRRNLYSSKSKPAWIAGGLERLRALLEEAASHPIGDKVNFRDAIAQITEMLEQ